MLRTLSICMFALTACGGSDPAMMMMGDDEPPVDAAAATVMAVACAGGEMAVESTGGFRFAPAAVTISVGDAVSFTNPTSHSVVPSPTLVTDSGLRAPANATTCLTFTAAGTFNYQCSPHSSMKGTITVNP
jgi:plastocyanin